MQALYEPRCEKNQNNWHGKRQGERERGRNDDSGARGAHGACLNQPLIVGKDEVGRRGGGTRKRLRVAERRRASVKDGELLARKHSVLFAVVDAHVVHRVGADRVKCDVVQGHVSDLPCKDGCRRRLERRVGRRERRISHAQRRAVARAEEVKEGRVCMPCAFCRVRRRMKYVCYNKEVCVCMCVEQKCPQEQRAPGEGEESV